jgi:hypothetical protein
MLGFQESSLLDRFLCDCGKRFKSTTTTATTPQLVKQGLRKIPVDKIQCVTCRQMSQQLRSTRNCQWTTMARGRKRRNQDDGDSSGAESLNSQSLSIQSGIDVAPVQSDVLGDAGSVLPEAIDDAVHVELPDNPPPVGCPWIVRGPLKLCILTVSMGSVNVRRRVLHQGTIFLMKRSPWITRIIASYEAGLLQHKHCHFVFEGFVNLDPVKHKAAVDSFKKLFRAEVDLRTTSNGGEDQRVLHATDECLCTRP